MIFKRITDENWVSLASLPCTGCWSRSLIFRLVAFSMHQKWKLYSLFHCAIKKFYHVKFHLQQTQKAMSEDVLYWFHHSHKKWKDFSFRFLWLWFHWFLLKAIFLCSKKLSYFHLLSIKAIAFSNEILQFLKMEIICIFHYSWDRLKSLPVSFLCHFQWKSLT